MFNKHNNSARSESKINAKSISIGKPSPATTNNSPTTFLQAAIFWFKFGFAVIPLLPNKKQTAVKWNPWLDKLSEKTITNYWSKHPEHELGFIVGNDFIVFDADSPEAISALAMLEKIFDIEPSLTVSTTKGVHHYFQRQQGSYAKNDSHCSEQHPGRIDVKTGRGMVILPPSNGKFICIEEAENANELVEVNQEFIDAVFIHNGRQAPRPNNKALLPKSNPKVQNNLTEQIRALLNCIDPDNGYDKWLHSGMATHYETKGSDEGLSIFNDWSEKGTKYPGYDEIKYKWDSFDNYNGTPITIAFLRKMVGEKGHDWMEICSKTEPDFEVCEFTFELPKSDINPKLINITVGDQDNTQAPIDNSISTNDDEIINQLVAMTTLEYERARVEQAKSMGCRPAVLDELVKAARKGDTESSDLPFKEIEPYPTPVDPASLLNEISAAILRFIVMDPEQADAAALWVALTWLIDVVEVAPLAMINAPEKACGKSQLLDVLGRMSARPLPVANTSTAALFRSVELWGPTVLIDEADTFLRDNGELKGLINAGHTRVSAFVLRVVGDDHNPKRFKVWGAKALAGISLEKHLPDSTMSRAIVLNLRRKLPHESVTRLRHADAGLFEDIASKLARFADDHSQLVQQARPKLPDELSDRAQDNWEPLMAIAQCAGSEWVLRANAAALKLSGANEERVSTGNELLADIQQIFITKGPDKIRTADLISALVADEEKPWSTYNRGKPITPRQVAKLLSGYGIKPKTVRFGRETPKGYEAKQFTDVFARYLGDPDNLSKQRNASAKSLTGKTNDVSDTDDVAATPTAEETSQVYTSFDGCGVADNSEEEDCAGNSNSIAEGTYENLL